MAAAEQALACNALTLTYQLLEEAYRLRGDVETLSSAGALGVCGAAQRRSVRSVSALRAGKEGPLGDEHPEVPKVLAEPLPPAGEVLILGERGSLVLVDERLVGTLPLSAPLLLPAGNIQVVLELAARRKQQDLDIHSGSSWLLRSTVDSEDIAASLAPIIVFLPHYRGLDGEAIRQLEQAAEQAAHGSGHILKRREMAMTAAPQLASCLDSLLCQGRAGQAQPSGIRAASACRAQRAGAAVGLAASLVGHRRCGG